jgi:hypothetical protein
MLFFIIPLLINWAHQNKNTMLFLLKLIRLYNPVFAFVKNISCSNIEGFEVKYILFLKGKSEKVVLFLS